MNSFHSKNKKMITSLEQAKEIALAYNRIRLDSSRLVFLKEHKNELNVILDNDYTAVGFNLNLDKLSELEREEIDEINLNGFDDFHGDRNSIVQLFKFAGIFAEQC